MEARSTVSQAIESWLAFAALIVGSALLGAEFGADVGWGVCLVAFYLKPPTR